MHGFKIFAESLFQSTDGPKSSKGVVSKTNERDN